ncbi:MAG: c-type cytochrome [Maritimibacter sp.]|nr:c-type cytochrome [Maritimibacter sp.]
MKTILTAAAALLTLSAGAAFAASDVDAGEKDFKKCKACHSIVDPAGETVVKGGKTGPNLWGVVGRQAGTEAEFGKYTAELVALGEGGLVWNEEEMAKYIPDAKEYIGGKTSMTPQKLDDVTDVIAYLAQFQ